MRLLTKFTLIFIAVFGIGLGASAYLFHGLLRRNAREQVLYNAQLMMDTALAMRGYTSEQVNPAIKETMGEVQRAEAQPTSTDDIFRDLCAKRGFIGKRVFRPQTVPAFAATELFSRLRKNYPDYFYKEAAPNPTNPSNRAVDWEEDIIKEFKQHPEMQAFEGQRETPLGRTLYLARPMRVSQKACLECHSSPSKAPPEMVQLYGTANGFGWGEGDIIAAQIVAVPVSLPIQMANRAFRHLIVSLIVVCLATLVVMDVLLYFTVVRPVGNFASRADEISKGQLDVPELPVRGKDEISILASAFNRMHRSVKAAMQMLEGAEEPPPPEQESEQEPEPE